MENWSTNLDRDRKVSFSLSVPKFGFWFFVMHLVMYFYFVLIQADIFCY